MNDCMVDGYETRLFFPHLGMERHFGVKGEFM